MQITLTKAAARRRKKQQSLAHRARKRLEAAGRATAMKLTWAVAALQGAVLLTFALVPANTPPRLPLMDLLWAASRKPQFSPLVALLVGGPVLSALAWQARGTHRALLVIFWSAFLAVVVAFHLERVRMMLRVLAWQYL